MRAAVVTSFESLPTCQEFPEPPPAGPGQMVVDVIAAGLHPRVRSQANGSHYTSTGELPFVPGVDGVGRAGDGSLVYFVPSGTVWGSMAERTVIPARRAVVLADDANPVVVAAGMNPAMSSWVALRRRISFAAGQSVLVIGATGSAGRMAVQIAKHLGAGRVVGAGRDPGRLAELAGLGADATVSLTSPDAYARLAAEAADVDVVIDYVWGDTAAGAMPAIVTARSDGGRPWSWIQIGATSGPTATIPSAALRSTRLQIVGSGQGSVPAGDIAAELPALAEQITAGAFRVAARTVPLDDVEAAWSDTSSVDRAVITTGGR